MFCTDLDEVALQPECLLAVDVDDVIVVFSILPSGTLSAMSHTGIELRSIAGERDAAVNHLSSDVMNPQWESDGISGLL